MTRLVAHSSRATLTLTAVAGDDVRVTSRVERVQAVQAHQVGRLHDLARPPVCDLARHWPPLARILLQVLIGRRVLRRLHPCSKWTPDCQ